jgi:hypothetical protein
MGEIVGAKLERHFAQRNRTHYSDNTELMAWTEGTKWKTVPDSIRKPRQLSMGMNLHNGQATDQLP